MNNDINDSTDTSGRDANRDPITGAPGSHPVGVAAGGSAGALAGAAIGSIFGPIGTLVGGAVGAIGGAAGGKAVAERVDPTAEVAYWREDAPNREYYDKSSDFDRDYAPAYRLGTEHRNEAGATRWEDAEPNLQQKWDQTKDTSSLPWDKAKPAVRDAFDRTDRTYKTYGETDSHFSSQYDKADYYKSDYSYDDYQSAYRYGTQARSTSASSQWDDATEARLGQGWDSAKGNSRLSWDDAKSAVRDAWHRVERAMPGDGDRDGR
ncbi:MAG TPA: hypothetical protein VLK29_11385 [Luteimonas sp.]|nr:hypothetical protein [Luteimonas sp.]